VQGITEGAAKGKTSGVLDAALEKVEQVFGSDKDRREREEVRRRPPRREQP